MTVQNKSNQIPEWVILNNQIVDGDGNIKDLNKDKEAVRSYFLNEINKKTQFFHSLKEKLEYLTTNDYYETEFLEKYTFDQIQAVYDIAYDAKFRFPTYMGAFKFYNDYALKSIDAERVFLERYEDRLSVIALYHADGDFELAKKLITSLIAQDFTPATPTLLNTGKKKRGEFVSCFLLEVDDSLNDIARVQEFAMQLSKLGGGVSINLTNLRAKGESIKDIPNVAKGVVGVAKLLDNAFRYADQMGQRQGAGAVYLNVFHADIEDFLQTK
ncbi:ribonucleotide reductase N-terminal alpha domain-containing protein, partial [Erysipelothrix rhusiopathiae]|nr:ribonucleotide reductase N-terminal alpha domain-containing protein [Erysipelothrix rhusiopathiae]